MPGVSPQRSVRTAVLAAALATAAWPAAPALFGQPAPPRPPAAAGSATDLPPAPAPAAGAPARPGAPLDLAARVRDTWDREYSTLTGANVPQLERTEQARRLLSHATGESKAMLERAAQNPAARQAVATALIDDPVPDPTSVRLLASMLGSDDETTTAAARALAASGRTDDALGKVINFINTPNVRDSMRAAAARGLGSASDRQAADALRKLLDDKQAFIRNAACDALAEMTGVTENGRDVDAWVRWLDQQKNKSDDQFREAILARLKRQPTGMAPEAMDLIQRLYQNLGAAQANQKPAVLAEMLAAPNPAERIVGTRAYEQDALLGQVPPSRAAALTARVHDMVGDSSPPVREQVARTLGTLADKSALEGLATQLAQETEPQVKVELIRALARMGDLRVVPQLLQLLNDPSARVRAASADAMRALAPQIRSDAAVSQQVVGALRSLIANNAGDVRAAAVEALVPLADAGTLQLFVGLLDPREDEPTRLAALRGIAQLGDQRAATRVSELMTADKERLPRVRLAALDAFARVGNFASSETLFNIFTNPAQEPDPSVRERAWTTFQALLPTASDDQLREYAGRFSRMAVADANANQPEKSAADLRRRVAVLQEIEARDAKRADANSQADLAGQRENIGAAYMQLRQPKLAIAPLRQALDYWLKNNGGAGAAQQVIGELMDALLASQQYAEAVKFADEMIARNREMERIVAPRLANRAEDLLEPPSPGPGRPRPPANPRDALTLATEAAKLPTLSENYRRRLADVQTKAAQAVGAPAPGTGAPPPP